MNAWLNYWTIYSMMYWLIECLFFSNLIHGCVDRMIDILFNRFITCFFISYLWNFKNQVIYQFMNPSIDLSMNQS